MAIPTSRTARVVLGGLLVLTAALAVVLAWAGPAAAHGISGDAAQSSTLGFVVVGAEHMLLGWDHLLFVAGIVLLAPDLNRAAKTISAFAAGHSLALIMATLAGWQVDATLVDVVIIVSVAVVGLFGMFGGVRAWDLFGLGVFLFGLVHGLGLATRFQALGVPDDGLVDKLVAFNVGVELGQLTAIVGMLGLGALASMLVGDGRHDATLRKVAFVVLFAVGAMAAPLLALDRLSGDDDVDVDVALPPGAPCTVGPREITLPAAGGGHSGEKFSEPDQVTPLADLGYALGDGYVVVLYPADLEPDAVGLLRDHVTEDEVRPVLAGAREDGIDQLSVLTSSQQMDCDDLHLGALRQFSDTWLTSVGYES